MKRSQRRTRANLTKMQQAEVFEERQMLSAVSASIDSADSAAAATDGTGNNAVTQNGAVQILNFCG